MKRFAIMALTLVLACTAFAGCRRADHEDETKPTTTPQTTPVATTTTPTTPQPTTSTTPMTPDESGANNGDNGVLPGETDGDVLPGDSGRSRFRRMG